MVHGFKELRKVQLDELNATMHEMVHESTGLKLLWLERDEENKTFGIAFPTFPEDSTGVFHIIEHSVLCGSKRYPVKDPFVELLKSSMNTFLNAMTFEDKTFYPISSKNDKDFVNLMRVYLDAVFNTTIYSTPECFMQEGWHYELDDNGTLSYKGVVFNEMKGVFADPDAKLDAVMSKALFPDNAYGYVSGGDPKEIPSLTYEQFLAAHKKHYSPANAFIILDGDLNIDETLGIINDEFLCNIEAGKAVDLPEIQKPVNAGKIEVEYEIPAEEEADNRCILAYGRVIGTFEDTEKIVAVKALSDFLCGSIQSPLNSCLLNDGLAESVTIDMSDIVLQPQLTLKIQNFKQCDKAEIEKRVFDTLNSLVKNGIDKEQLDAALTHLEFQMRERDFGPYPQGLMFGMDILDSWLYGGKPEVNLEVGELFERLHKKIDSGYFELLINNVFINNNHCCEVMMIPSKTVGDKARAEEVSNLKTVCNSLSDEQKAKIKSDMQMLDKWQNTPDAKDAIATLPKLTLADIKAQPENVPTSVKSIDNIPCVTHSIDSNGILYVNMYFNANGLSEDEISLLSFTSALLGELNTDKHTAAELVNIKRKLCGVINCSLVTYEKENSKKCNTYFKLRFSTLEKNALDALNLALEILTQTDFSNADNAYSLLCKCRMDMLQYILLDGAQIAMGRTAAQLTPAGVINECTSGYNYYRWLKNAEENWNFEKFSSDAKRLLSKIIASNRLTVSITGKTDEEESIVKHIANKLTDNNVPIEENSITAWGEKKEGIAIPADISFAVSAADLTKTDKPYCGSATVAAKIVGLNYLWSTIRMQGGAYGTGMLVRPSGIVYCYSYRDPSAARSLKSFESCGDYLNELAQSGADISGFIIGTVADATPVLTPMTKGIIGDRFYFQGISFEDRCERMKQIVNTTTNDLQEFANAFNDSKNSAGVCVVGNSDLLSDCNLDNILSI